MKDGDDRLLARRARSSVGFAGIGAWLLALNRGERVMAWPRALRRLGIAAGAVTALGIVAAPGIILQLDDMETTPSWVWLGELGWLGIYAIYPAWALLLGFTGNAPRARCRYSPPSRRARHLRWSPPRRSARLCLDSG